MIKNNKFKILVALILIAVIFAGCKKTPANPTPPTENQPVEIMYKFEEDEQGFKGDFADVPAVTAGKNYNLKFERANIPVPGQESNGLMLQGNNVKDKIFLFTYVKLNDMATLEPNTTYKTDISFVLASNIPSNSSDVADNVTVKAGIVVDMPMLRVENELNKLNIDIGQKGVDSEYFRAVGNIAKLNSEDDSFQYKKLSTSLDVMTGAIPDLYLLIGIEINSKVQIQAYIDDVKVEMVKK